MSRACGGEEGCEGHRRMDVLGSRLYGVPILGLGMDKQTTRGLKLEPQNTTASLLSTTPLMDDTPDPATQFFPGVAPEDIDLYATLKVAKDAKDADIKQSYRKLALLYHPDKHSTASPEAQAEASTKFQQIGFAYAVLSDAKKRERYDKTGRTDEGAGLEPGEGGWEAYFEDLFDKVTRGKLDELKKEYQGRQFRC